jgi:TDG/mug DNA glycosylase family protein
LLESVAHRLPDQLRPNLRLVFVGTAGSTRSAELGHYYAHPGNRFRRAIHEAGITPRRYQPDEFAALIALDIGFTGLSKSGASTNSSSAPILIA